MRPIDADRLKAVLEKNFGHTGGASVLGQLIDEQPTIQPEPAIPLSWIENEIKWLKSLDNTFSEITALQISAMVKKWRDEQNDRTD